MAVLVLALAGCTAPADPEPTTGPTAAPVSGPVVGGYGDLHVAPDGSMMFCYSDPDPGFTGVWRECQDGIGTVGVDPAAIDATLGETATADPGGHRWVGAAAGKRTAEDGTDVYTVFLAGTRTDDAFTVTAVGEGSYRVSSEYQELQPGVPGGFLVRLEPIG
ncbi:hypothetical protein C5C41_16610 [Rathayibacter sp. AY1E9]|nr:hypothetical protein C5C41_16610 [Rathayibacter sp. AY1E9]PPG56131.1 hypothetical protein C5C57_15520 [Rathayibacter sp. AY1C5]PPH08113.1 hypothetical protein C5C33_05740 [Rathayibacter sp. AY1H3]PPH78272.1 hypothetical protein C5C50_14630 [Rathayibacter sp. AY1D9]